MLIDSHFHLEKYRNHKALYGEINELKQYSLCVTCTPGVFLSCLNLYPETKFIRFALGIHPIEIAEPQRCLFEFDHCFSKAKYIGEVGLDYGKGAPSRDSQLMVFKHIVKKQAMSEKPMSIHCRGAENDMIDILSEFPGKKRIIHWYTGSSECLTKLVTLGCYFSINTSMVSNNERAHALKSIPVERILVESDGPYTRVNGKKYSPHLLKEAYAVIGSALCMPSLEKVVYHNFGEMLMQ